MTTSWPTVTDYTFDLAERLREAGSTSIAQFEASLQRDCYDWLDDYLDNIEAQGRRANIAELMKTPSRTATAKKTRAAATTTKTRAEQVRQFNLALSPLAKTPAGRIPFSPLQSQSVNSVPQSPTRSPLKGKAKLLTTVKDVDEEPEVAAKPPPKKRGRPKKNADKENEEPSEPTSKSTRSKAKTPASKPSTKSRKGKAKVVESEPEPVVEPKPEPVVEPEPEPVVEQEPEPIVQDEPVPPFVVEPPTLAAAEEMVAPVPEDPIIVVDDSFETIALESAAPQEEELLEVMDVDEPEPETELPSVSPIKAASPIKSPSPKQTSPVKEASPVKTATPPAPVPTRQVRSSWLSQALGTNTVPIGSSHRTSTQFDHLRKSQMTASTSKRKSEAAEEDELPALDKQRPDKVARFNPAATDAASGLPVSPKKQSQFGSSRPPASATSLPQASVSTPATASTRLAATSVPQAQGRMSKLQEMKERTAAAAAAKQQEKAAAMAAATSEESAPMASNGGFLRGLGGFLGRSAPIEADRDRMAQELAERELSRVLQELAEQDRKAEEARLAKEREEAAKAVETEDAYESEDFGDRAIIIDDESADEYEVHDSVTLPSLPGDDSYLEDDEDDPMEGTALSALAAAGIQVPVSTTPMLSPPRSKPSRIAQAAASPTPVSRIPAPSIVVSPPPKPKATKSKPVMPAPIRTNSRAVTPSMSRAVTPSSAFDDDEADDEDEELYTKPRKGESSRSALNSSMSSTTSVLTQAERMAGKVLGVKATPNRIKSVHAAEAAAKKEQQDKERRAKAREQVERKKAEEKKRKEEAERAKEEEERQKRLADEEERRRKLAHNDKIRRMKMEKAEQLKKQREAEALKLAEEEAAAAAAKRKAALALTKSASSSNLAKSTQSSLNKAAGAKTPAGLKRIAPPSSAKGKEPLLPSKAANLATAGPSDFRTEGEPSSTIKSVAPNRPALGPPSRTSHLGNSNATSSAGPSRPSAARTHAATLQQQRATLQAQLDQKALDAESENIVLPDINSEYSNSDDESDQDDFKRPAWAESPELKQALEMQASVNPDELFGPIRPLSMEELFNARHGKFRARTSSANWSGADRLTEQEEREYARRMGFRPINAPRDGGA